jgi:AcrR family transcriptional regulator
MATRTKRLTREEQREITRERLLAAAKRLFVKQGFAATSVEEIAEAAGFTRGAFYSNFEDKDDIFIAILDTDLRTRIDELTGIFSEAADLQAAFAAIIRSNEDREVPTSAILQSEFWLYAVRNPKVRRRLAEHQRTERRAFERAIQAQFDAVGLDVPVELHDAALVLLALDTAAPRLRLIDPDDVHADFFFQAVLDLFEAAQALARERTRRGL